MKYYKLLNDGEFIGVGTSYDLRKFQLKHSILLTSDDESAQYIEYSAAVEHPWPGALYSGVAGN